MRTRSKVRAELAGQAQLAHSNPSQNEMAVPPPEVLETGFTMKRRRSKEEVAGRNTMKNQSVGNRIFADTLKIQRRRSGGESSSRNGARGKQADQELTVLRKRKRKMRGSLREKNPAKRGRGDEDSTPSIQAYEGARRDEVIQRIKDTLTIGLTLEGAEEQPDFRPMTAKMRWKDRARSTINENEVDPPPSIGVQTPFEEQNFDVPPHSVSPSAFESLSRQKLEVSRLLEERGDQTGRGGNIQQIQNGRKLKITRQRSLKPKRQQRACRKRIGVLEALKLWATQTKFLQNTLEPDGNATGATELRLVMTENDRENFVQKMVEQCRNDRDLRSSFLESVKMVVSSGLMHSAASTLLQEGPCEEAQVVVKAWENFKLQQSASKGLPMDLLNAVVKLHENRKDLSGELARFEGSGSCSLRQMHNSMWHIQIRNCALMEKFHFHEGRI